MVKSSVFGYEFRRKLETDKDSGFKKILIKENFELQPKRAIFYNTMLVL